jgi:4,5-DOPA dioxygenase extradiol
VLCISAHWETPGYAVTASDRPETIHDFYGFPKELFNVRYPAPGEPSLAARIAGARQDVRRGLDHGAWSVLCAMYREADVPVVQLSLDTRRTGAQHYALGRELGGLREEGVLVMASGNIVHNLRVLDWARDGGYEWAERARVEMVRRIVAGADEELTDWRWLDPEARAAIPTAEHYLPMLYVLALREKGEDVEVFSDRTVMGSIAMTSFVTGAVRTTA